MEQALYQAAILTFEELGFVFPFADEEKGMINEEDSVRVGVVFNGPFSGELVLQMENEALSTVAANMMGTEEPLENELVHDVLGELANVICGNALPAIAGKQEIFRLKAPEIRAGVEHRSAAAAAAVGMDEGRAAVSLYIN